MKKIHHRNEFFARIALYFLRVGDIINTAVRILYTLLKMKTEIQIRKQFAGAGQGRVNEASAGKTKTADRENQHEGYA